MVVARGTVLETADFPQKLGAGPSDRQAQNLQVGMTVHEVEQQPIMKTLEACKGNRTEAATILAISTRTLRNKLHEYGAMGAYKNGGEASFEAEELVGEST